MKVHENIGVDVTKMLSIEKLQVGDIILSTTDEEVSEAVRLSTASKFSHARIYIGDSTVIEAVDPEVADANIRKLLAHDKYTYVYRMPSLTPAQKSRIVEYARAQKGKKYDLSGAMGAPSAMPFNLTALPKVANFISPESDFYCSELVAFAYKYAGVKLTQAASQTTPKDLAMNKKLIFVGRLK